MTKKELIELIDACQTADEVESLLLSEMDLNVDKRGKLETVKKKAIAMINGDQAGSAVIDLNGEDETDSEDLNKIESDGLSHSVSGDIAPINITREDVVMQTEPLSIGGSGSVTGNVAVHDSRIKSVKKVMPGERFLRRKKDKRVFMWTPSLAKDADIYECDVNGNLHPDADFEEVMV
jgi:hypothetical protein